MTESLDDTQDFIKEFIRTTGRLPNITDMFLYAEAKASIAIDNDSEVRTRGENDTRSDN